MIDPRPHIPIHFLGQSVTHWGAQQYEVWEGASRESISFHLSEKAPFTKFTSFGRWNGLMWLTGPRRTHSGCQMPRPWAKRWSVLRARDVARLDAICDGLGEDVTLCCLCTLQRTGGAKQPERVVVEQSTAFSYAQAWCGASRQHSCAVRKPFRLPEPWGPSTESARVPKVVLHLRAQMTSNAWHVQTVENLCFIPIYSNK